MTYPVYPTLLLAICATVAPLAHLRTVRIVWASGKRLSTNLVEFTVKP